MNIFRVVGDMLHLASFGLLFLKMLSSKSVEGISRKTQEMYLLVFISRYLDLFSFSKYDFLHLYNFIMKTVYISASAIIVYYFRFKQPWRASYKANEDSFRYVEFAILPCAVLALFIHKAFTIRELFWAFSIYLEAISIFPQLILMQRYGNVENLTANYVFTLGGYRALYILNWIDRYMTEEDYLLTKSTWIVWISGFVQTLLYCDFFYYYALSKFKGRVMLPR